METIIAHPQTEDRLNVLTAFFKEQNIEFEKESYNPEFVKKLKRRKGFERRQGRVY